MTAAEKETSSEGRRSQTAATVCSHSPIRTTIIMTLIRPV